MGAYIIFPENFTQEDRVNLDRELKKIGYPNSCRGPVKEKAVGVCTYCTCQGKSYTYLDEDMASEKTMLSWIGNRKKIETVEEFLDYAKTAMEEMLARQGDEDSESEGDDDE